MRRALLIAPLAAASVLAGGGSAPAGSAPGVEVMVAGRSAVLAGPRPLRAPAARLRVGGRSCRIGANTPLAALAALRRRGGPSFAVRDYGSCSRDRRDAGGLFVTRIGRERGRRSVGWVYKVGRRVSSAGAADPDSPSVRGRRLTWFWCRQAGRCQRTLELRAPARVEAGQAVAITVMGYDDAGRGALTAGATVRLGDAEASTDASGRVTLAAPRTPGAYSLTATRPGLVPAFPERVLVE